MLTKWTILQLRPLKIGSLFPASCSQLFILLTNFHATNFSHIHKFEDKYECDHNVHMYMYDASPLNSLILSQAAIQFDRSNQPCLMRLLGSASMSRVHIPRI